jgi:hypothetical protein
MRTEFLWVIAIATVVASLLISRWIYERTTGDSGGAVPPDRYEQGRTDERDRCLAICAEMEQHWSDYKDTALLNGDVDLSNAASGEPRAARAIADLIRKEPT